MKNQMKTLMLTAAVLALTAGAVQAAETPNDGNPYYLSLGAGWNHEDDADFKTGRGKQTLGFDEGWLGEVAVGHAYSLFNQNWRTEIEGSYRTNTAKDTGRFSSWNAMLNQIYDFKTNSPWSPYIGAGVGASFQRANDLGSTAAAPGVVSDSDTEFAYQGIVGIDYQTTPHSTWGLRYNYFGTLDGKFDTTSPAVGGARGEYQNNSILVTYRWSWGAAPQPMAAPKAAAMPPPAPMMTTQTTTIAAPTEQQIEDSPYKIFFANDSYKLTNNAQQVIADAATAAGAQHAVVLQLTSNTDTTGSQQLNDRLSEKRAQAVRKALLAQGVSADKISVISNAERDLPVPTGPDVKEPRNRVVTIVLQ